MAVECPAFVGNPGAMARLILLASVARANSNAFFVIPWVPLGGARLSRKAMVLGAPPLRWNGCTRFSPAHEAASRANLEAKVHQRAHKSQ